MKTFLIQAHAPRVIVAIGVAATILFACPPAWSFNIWNRATDNSVCDFSPMTSLRLASATAVPARTQNEADIYARLVLRTAAKECRDGQVLILHSEDGGELDASYFPRAANRLCTVADIQRRDVGTQKYPKAFELRCTITKMDFARPYINQLEAEQTTEALVAAGQPQRSAQPSQNVDPICAMGKSMGAGAFLCANDPAPPAPKPAPRTDSPCWGAVAIGSGCK